ncbi:class I adenylate-forming enzyme family protein [Jeotgalibacillus terrae]|uniref:Class I adenylate-forming enzyme family protein n=1 Tax=Jeotgalibacillus terrae TaxID=587735 RepID=A0ABW5ZKE2_9BACL|nr:AMP-binding protein [Jeotgalibacillus terrae]MBM7579672.1 fatty-acyl-CoA synthase [Jeotgalibacillus terrae]
MSATTHWLQKRISMTPAAPALVDIDTQDSWTYLDLGSRIGCWQTYLSRFNMKKGDRIAFLGANTIHMFPLLFACSYMGLVFTPLNIRLHPAEIKAILQDADPALVITDEEMKNHIEHSTYHVIQLDDILQEKQDQPMTAGAAEPEAISVMIYTGGTTGSPKGVMLSNRAIEWNAINTIVSWGLTEADRTLTYMPLFHTGGLNALAMPILMAGGQVMTGNKFQPEKVIGELNDYQITIALFVPTMYQMMINTGKLGNRPFPSMKTFLSGGAPCPLSIYQYFEQHQLPFKQGYGLSEAGPNNFMMPLDDAQRYKGSVGKPMIYADIGLFDEEGHEIQTPHTPGEIRIKGPHLFSGYWQRPDESKAAFHNGWFKTGDLAELDTNGNYTIRGRKKEMIISGGENIYPQEIETVLNLLAGVRDQAVIGRHDDQWGEVPVAFVSLSDQHLTVSQIRTHCQAHLSGYKCPAQIYIVPELPKTAVGKLDKRMLQKWSEDGEVREGRNSLPIDA